MVKETQMKQTEIGLIPEDWEVVKLSELSKLITKGTTPKEFISSGINYVKIESFFNDKIISEKCLKISPTIHDTELRRSILEEDDLLFAIAGATIGKCAKVRKSILPANTNQALAIIRLNTTINSDFVFYNLKSKLMANYVIDNAIGGAQPNLNLQQVGSFQIPLPPLAEQEAIAVALSDCDAWIESLESVIAKKRVIKQGAMQELLTPKVDWEVKKLGEVFKLKQGVQCGIEKQYVSEKNGFVKFIRIIDITQKNIEARYIKDPGFEHHICEEDLFMVRYGAPGIVGFNKKGVIANNLFRLIPKATTINSYFKHVFDFMRPYFEEVSSSSTMAALNFTTLNNIDLFLPPLSEQTHIATVLSDMDAELEALDQKLNKARQIKQGMMQELLTGRVRLV